MNQNIDSEKYRDLLGKFLDETAVTMSTLAFQCEQFVLQCEREGFVPPHPGTVQRALIVQEQESDQKDLHYVGYNKKTPQKQNNEASNISIQAQSNEKSMTISHPLNEKLDEHTPEFLAHALKIVGKYPKSSPESIAPILTYHLHGLSTDQACQLAQCLLPSVSEISK